MKSLFIILLLSIGFTTSSFTKVDSNLETIKPPVLYTKPVIFQDAFYKGNNTTLNCTEVNLGRHGWGDKISSCIVPKGWKLVFYLHSGYRGPSFTIDSDVKEFRDYDWHDRVSSVKVYYNDVLQSGCYWR